jgi:hypothetical protein
LIGYPVLDRWKTMIFLFIQKFFHLSGTGGRVSE